MNISVERLPAVSIKSRQEIGQPSERVVVGRSRASRLNPPWRTQTTIGVSPPSFRPCKRTHIKNLRSDNKWLIYPLYSFFPSFLGCMLAVKLEPVGNSNRAAIYICFVRHFHLLAWSATTCCKYPSLTVCLFLTNETYSQVPIISIIWARARIPSSCTNAAVTNRVC